MARLFSGSDSDDSISDSASDDSLEDINEEEFLVNAPIMSDSASDDSDDDSEDRPAPKYKIGDKVLWPRVRGSDAFEVTDVTWEDKHWEYIIRDDDDDELMVEESELRFAPSEDDSEEDINEEEFFSGDSDNDSEGGETELQLSADDETDDMFDNLPEGRPAPKFKVGDKVEHIRDSGDVWGTMRVISINWKNTHWEYTLHDEEGDEEKLDESELQLSVRPPSPAHSPMRVDDESKEVEDEVEDVTMQMRERERIENTVNLLEAGDSDNDSEQRPPTKFKDGDKVVFANDARMNSLSSFYVVDRIYWYNNEWVYELLNENGTPINGMYRENFLKRAPKFKVGDKVVMGSFTIHSYEVAEVNWRAHGWRYNIRATQRTQREYGPLRDVNDVLERTLRPAPKFKFEDKVVQGQDLNNRYEIRQTRWSSLSWWTYKLRDEDNDEIGFSSEDNLRIAPKFKVGDKVLYLREKFKVTDVHWWVSRDDKGAWEYKLRRNDGSETDYLLGANLRPAPKFKVGDKVVVDRHYLVGRTFEVKSIHWFQLPYVWKYELNDEEGNTIERLEFEGDLDPAPENRNKRKRDSEEVQQEKKKYLADPLTKESDCAICGDPLLGPVNKLEDGKVINVGLDRELLDDKGNVIGKEKIDEVVIMYCCGNGFHKRCIDKALKLTEVDVNLGWGTYQVDKARKCPVCNTDLSAKLDAGKPVYRNAEVVKSGKETVEVETVTEVRLCAERLRSNLLETVKQSSVKELKF